MTFHLRPTCLLSAALLFSAANLLRAEDWPQWRGPDRQGASHDNQPLLATLPPAGPPQLWLYPCPGGHNGGEGSIVVAQNRAYLYVCWRDDKAKTITDTYLCVDAVTGKEIWKVQYPGKDLGGEGCSATPCVADGRVYVAGSGRKAYCFNAADGTLIWQAPVGAEGNHSSFLVADGLAVIASMNLMAFDAQTGKPAWDSAEVRSCESSPALWKHAGKSYVICHDTNRDTGCFDLKTGALMWKAPGKGYPSVVVAGDILISHGGNGTGCFKLSPTGAELQWSSTLSTGGITPIVHDGMVYVVGGNDRLMTCLNLADGKVVWQQKIDPAEFSSPIYADGKIFAVVEKKNLLLLSATPAQPQILGKAKMNIQYFTSPALVQGRLYLRLETGLACFDVRATPAPAAAPSGH